MSIAITKSAQLIGLDTEIVTVEVDISNGLHSFTIIGLGDRSIDEARDRVSSAIKNSGFVSPKQKNQKVVVSLAPANMRKEGSAFDLSIALSYLLAIGEISFDSSDRIFIGELSLEGKIQKISGILPLLLGAKKLGIREAYIPRGNEMEASLVTGMKIFGISSLIEIIEHLENHKPISFIKSHEKDASTEQIQYQVLMEDVKGNMSAKRGLEIAAAGSHNILLYGPPGTGKTMLARAFQSILPPLSFEHAIEVTSIHSIAETLENGLILQPPFRSPHHSSSAISIIGGGIYPKPGEITLAHRGVLFMDEFPEFERVVLEALRQPLEEKSITIARARSNVTFPAQTILIASMNMCPCGRSKDKGCTCTERAIANYWRKLSGPIMDRIDMYIHIDKIDYDSLTIFHREKVHNSSGNDNDDSTQKSYDSESMRKRIKNARILQKNRFLTQKKNINFNSEMNHNILEKSIKISEENRYLFREYAKKMELSGRALHRILKVAQTIADLANRETIQKKDLLEALNYRKRFF